jgi:hypothetical protein
VRFTVVGELAFGRRIGTSAGARQRCHRSRMLHYPGQRRLIKGCPSRTGVAVAEEAAATQSVDQSGGERVTCPDGIDHIDRNGGHTSLCTQRRCRIRALAAQRDDGQLRPQGEPSSRDVLDGVARLRICTAYRHFGQTLHHLPASTQAQAGVEPLYEELDGWQESTRGARSFADLPAAAVKYVKRLEELVEAPVALLSTSPDRQDTILLRDPFAD